MITGEDCHQSLAQRSAVAAAVAAATTPRHLSLRSNTNDAVQVPTASRLGVIWTIETPCLEHIKSSSLHKFFSMVTHCAHFSPVKCGFRFIRKRPSVAVARRRKSDGGMIGQGL